MLIGVGTWGAVVTGVQGREGKRRKPLTWATQGRHEEATPVGNNII